MISRDATLAVERIPLGQLVIGEDLARDTSRVLTYTALLTGQPDHDMEPAIVERISADLYRIRNGHHRFVAAVIAGRADMLAVVVNERCQHEFKSWGTDGDPLVKCVHCGLVTG